jgi:hypothetical protein
MFTFAGCHEIDLPSAGRKSPSVLPPHAEKEDFGYISEVETDPSAVWAAVFPNFVPYDIALVLKPPSPHYFNPIRQKRVRNPEVKMRTY